MSDTPEKDPILKSLLQELETIELPGNFTATVMDALLLKPHPGSIEKSRIPNVIKIGIPLFLLICIGLLVIFPVEEAGAFQKLFGNITGESLVNFIDRINNRFESFQFPIVQLSKSITWYCLGGLGLIWMFVIFENFTRRFKKSGE